MDPHAPITWPASCYPAAVRDGYPLLEYAPGFRVLRRVLPHYLRDGLSVLDIGCGAGIGACHIAASGGRQVAYTGIDPDIVACRQAQAALAQLPPDRIRGRIVEGSLQQFLDARPSPYDLVLWTFAFHDCVDVAADGTHAALCAGVAGLVQAGGHLIVADGGFAPGASPEEIERTYTYMARIIGHSDRGRYFAPETIAQLFSAAGLTVLERHDVPLVALARYLALSHARATVFVFGKGDGRPHRGEEASWPTC